MRDRLGEFGDAKVVVVCFSAPEFVVAYQRDRLDPLTVVVDESREAYRAFGFGRGSIWRIWGPRTWLAYVRLIGNGRQFSRPTEDTLQLGGDVVVDRHGRIALLFASADPDDRPSVDDLLDAVMRR